MKSNHDLKFIAGVERLIKPTDVNAIGFLNSMTRLLPIGTQKKLMQKTAQDIPHMGFVVEPYSFFLCYPIIDIEAAKKLIPLHYTLIKTRIFADDDPHYYIIFGCFTAHTSAFWGSRIEMYVIAENQQTGLLTWVIVDYDSNTNSYDPAHGLIAATSTDTVMTTSYDGRYILDMKRDDGSRRLAAQADTTVGQMNGLDQRLWLEGNLSVDYGIKLRDSETRPFGLTFQPDEVSQALSLPLDSVVVIENNWHQGLYASMPTQIACFPYAQHFITDNYPQGIHIQNKSDLIQSVNKLGDLSDAKTLSAQPIKRQMIIGWALSTTISTAILIFTLIHFITAH